jgi:catechol 2,3-dioxygenase-like lactoylglutathione lyase family enzyme
MSLASKIEDFVPTAPKPKTVATRLEVVIIPVSDVDRAKRFYQSLGWRLDADFSAGDDWRALQLTPPGSPCSILLGKGLTTALPGSLQGTFLVVNDIEAARAELVGYGVAVSEVFHFEGALRVVGTNGRVPGPHPQRDSYASWASFTDPDGNGWLLQEITTRLPGRGLSNFDIPTLAELLREAEKGHGQYERTAPKHHWSTWYAPYIVARQQGKTADEAAREATLHMQSDRVTQ